VNTADATADRDSGPRAATADRDSGPRAATAERVSRPRAATADLDSGPRAATVERPEPSRAGRVGGKRPAPGPHPFWGLVFPLLVVAVAALVFAVWREGTKLVLDSNNGERRETITDPTAPGYQAFVDPTPTMLVAHLSDGGDLVGITVLARTALDQGGTAVLLSAETLLEPSDDPADAVFVGEVYEAAGMEGLSRLVGDVFGFGFRETLEITTSQLGGWLRLVEPLPVVLDDDLVSVGAGGLVETEYRAGFQQLSGARAAEVYGWLNEGEFDSNRTQRQADLWEAWLSRVGTADDLVAATLPFDDGLSAYLRALGTGSRRLEVLAVVAVSFGGEDPPFFALNEEQKVQLKRLAREMVPLPVGSHLGARPSVSLLDGTGAGLGDQMLPLLVDAGAEITVLGNAAVFGVEETTVAYHLADHRQAATALADAIGASTTFVEDVDSPADLTVTVGWDWAGS